MDMASQTWQQVLLADPRNVEALAGLARAAKLAGNMALSNTYLERLRKIDPDNANIARVQGMMTQESQSAQLAQAGKLASAGQYPQAMAVYRQVFGNEPPPGDWALAYYETESATDDGRAHAIAGLRALVERYPADSRYQVALGRILTYSPLTRNEGRKLLQKHPSDPQAVDALRQSLVWDSKNPASGADIRAYLMKHSDAQLSTALKNQPKVRPGASFPQTPEGIEAAARARAEDLQMQAAYRALNGKHIEEAEERFKEILADQPDSPRALAGMGYVRMQQSNFGGAISFLEQAEHDGTRDAGIETALASARFFYTMGEGAIALHENDLTTAEKQYQAALNMRPASPEALEGLGGTLLKAQQPQVAVQVYERYLKVKPGAAAAWRGLFMSQYGAGNAPEALATEHRIPAGVHAELMKDPDFLRTLASAYSAVGRDADAQRVLRTALDLPFPTDARGVRVETQLQYAGLLQQANRLDQAAGLFRQVLSVDPSNTSAWQGLIRVEHAMKQDTQALQTLEGMPPGSYDLAMRDPGFETTVASVYQAQNKLDIAQSILEKAVAQETSAGQRPPIGVEIQLAGIYLAQNNSRQAYPIYRQILSENPESTDAWKGLLSTLHSSGRDQEVIAQVQQIPISVRRTLENDVEYLQTIGNAYGTLGQPAQAMVFLNRVQRHYADQNSAPPADIDIQNAYLLFNGSNDTGLYRQLMILGGRQDLSSEQRRSVQTIWSLWAVRRANQAVAAGNNKRALAILNAAARSFPDNPGVLRALATGYARTGLPKQAVAIFKSQDMTSASASDYKAAVGAALAAGDVKSAETWLRFGLNEYPKDAEMLGLGAKFEQARGDSTRAAEYYRASLAAMPPPDPGAELANELSRPAPVAGMRLPSASQQQDLATLLGPGTVDTMTALGIAPEPAQSTQPAAPYLPAYGNAYGTAPVQLNGGDGSPIAQNYQPQSTGNAVPSYMTNPGYQTQQPAARNRPATLKDYVPQSATEPPGGYTMPLLLPDQGPNQQPVQQSAPNSMQNRSELPTSQPTATSGYQLNEQAYQQQQIRRLTEQAQNSVPPLEADADPLGSGPLSYQPTQPQTSARPQQQVVYGPYVPYVPPAENSIYTPSPVAVQLGDSTPHPTTPQREVTDVLPTARYVPNSPGTRGGTSQHPDIAAAQAAKARRRQSDPNLGMTGQSNPPAEEIANPVTQNTQYTPDSSLLPQPRTQPVQGRSNPDPQADSQTFTNPGQQYPQPGIRPATRKRATSPSQRNTSIADQPGLLYPGVAQPLTAQSYPVLGTPQAQGVPPTDADLVARMVPPLRGGYDASGKLNAPPLTAREATERELNTLESSYSAWMGGTGYARYRSGTVGFDRLTDLEATFEASVVAAKTARFTVIAQPVFLSNGLVDTATQQASTGVIPVLGTLPGNATATPAQQSANGVGGEFQMTTTNLGLAVGYTPYEFLVSNITGRARWRPGGGHFTFSADRSPVKETQLSYAGLRDPGSATAFFPGNIWGGVISSGGGLRFDKGDEKSGFYLSADGADITGFHVLENRKYDGTAGAYFRVKVFPQIGSLNVGATFFGEHYTHNELGLTYGQGGYFSPQSYFLAAVPISFTGHYLTDWHYVINGSVGVQTFQSSSAPYYPLDRATETGSANATYAATQNTGLNYSVNSEGSYRIADHWYMGAFLTGNNTNNYNTLTGGFFLRYLFKSQVPTEDYPTGLFPLEGFRPLRVP
jgi:tetratricopeptide (TPR) repeat protein